MKQKLFEILEYVKNGNLSLRDAVRVSSIRRLRPGMLKVRPLMIGHDVYLRGGESTDIDVFREIFVQKEYDFDLGFSPRTIVDAGANCGLSTIFFASKYPDSKIVALEPNPENFRMLERNICGNSRILVKEKALYPRECCLVIDNPDCGKDWAFQIREAKNGEGGFSSMTVPMIMDELGVTYIDILKLDIEGAEYELFKEGVEFWINKVNVIIIELHDFLKPGCSRPFLSALLTMDDFELYTEGESIVIIRTELLK